MTAICTLLGMYSFMRVVANWLMSWLFLHLYAPTQTHSAFTIYLHTPLLVFGPETFYCAKALHVPMPTVSADTEGMGRYSFARSHRT